MNLRGKAAGRVEEDGVLGGEPNVDAGVKRHARGRRIAFGVGRELGGAFRGEKEVRRLRGELLGLKRHVQGIVRDVAPAHEDVAVERAEITKHHRLVWRERGEHDLELLLELVAVIIS